MGNILDYIKWRGDLDFSQSEFNEIDNLIMAYVTLVDFTGIVPDCKHPDEYITMAEAKRLFDEKNVSGSKYLGLIIPEKVHDLFMMMAESNRFGQLRMSCYEKHIDEEVQKQFAAVTYNIGDGTRYVAFSGTDDTLVGWKEDFNMMFSDTVPAQRDALDYLEYIMSVYREPLRVGGHSKGGNLAVYAAMHSDKRKQKRIKEVYSNDGPGFTSITFNEKGYANIQDRVTHIIPKSSIVGLLMDNNGDYKVVNSSKSGIMQHDALTWQLKGNKFDYAEDVTRSSKHLDRSLQLWLDKSTNEDKQRFVDELFKVLTADGAKTLSELSSNKLKNLLAMFESVSEMDKTTKDMISKMVKLLIKETLDIEKVKELFIPNEKKEK